MLISCFWGDVGEMGLMAYMWRGIEAMWPHPREGVLQTQMRYQLTLYWPEAVVFSSLIRPRPCIAL